MTKKSTRTTTLDGIFSLRDGATVHGYSQCYAYTVVGISTSGKTVTLQRCDTRLLNGPESNEPDRLVSTPGGFCGHVEGIQRWNIQPDPTGVQVEAFLGKNGWMTRSRNRVSKGANEYYDFNF